MIVKKCNNEFLKKTVAPSLVQTRYKVINASVKSESSHLN